MKTESKALTKLNAERAKLSEKIAVIDAAIRAENKKIKEAQHRDALALLHKSGVLDDPARLSELLTRVTASAPTASGAPGTLTLSKANDHAQL